MEGIDGLTLLRRIKEKYPAVEVIMMTAFASQKTAVEALKTGASDYLIKPFEMEELVLRIQRIIQQKKLQEENRNLKSQVDQPVYFKEIIGRSQRMREIYRLIKKAAETDSTVLILGESGTGKELVAQTIHANSKRQKFPFVAINCAAVPENLLESELFGHEKGAFTGAYHKKIGKFEMASDGTIFLDEIGDMSVATQAKMLRVLQNKEISRVGGNQKIRVGCRVIAATHQNLGKMVQSKKFRQDLFYRLNVFPIQLPPLRERKEDIPELVNHFIQTHDLVGIDRKALRMMIDHDWPGNVRELENVIERASILADSIIGEEDLPDLNKIVSKNTHGFNLPEQGFRLDEFEKFLLHQALQRSDGNKTRAAELLGITRRRLYSMMKSLEKK
jgi:DNA-binding NtrC family response regulator